MCVFYLITFLFIIHTAPSKSSDEKEESKSNEQERGESSSNNKQQEDDQSNNILHHSSIPHPSINTNYYYSGSNQGQYQYYHDFNLLPGNHTRDNNNQYHSQTPLQYYPPNNVPSFIVDYTQNHIIQNNIPGSYLQPTPNNMTVHQLACNLGFDTYQYQPHMTYMQNLQQHSVASMSTGKRKFVPDEAVSNEYNTHNQPKHRKCNQDPIAASAIDFIGPPTNVDDINITSNPMVFQGNVADKAQGQSISRMKHPKGSNMIPSTFSKKPITNNVPCPPLCGAVFSRTGELVTFNNGQVKQIWSFQQINEGGSCDVQNKFPKTIADLTEMNRSLQALKLEHALETNESSCVKDDSSTSSNNNEEGDSNSSTSRTKTLANDSSCTKDNSSTLGNNKEGGSTSNNSRSSIVDKTRNYSSGDDTSSDDESISIISSSSSSSSSSNNSDSSSDESISYYKSKCRFIIATAQSVHEPDEAVLLKCLKADIAYFKKEYGSWKLSKWKERMKKFIKIPEWTGACEYRYTREYKESKQNIIHHTRFVVEEAEKILANYNDKKPMTVNAIKRKAKRDGWDKFAEFAKEQRKKWRKYQKESDMKWFQQQCDTISDLLQTQVHLETTTSVSYVRLCI